MTGLSRRLRKSDTTLAKVVVRYLRSRGIEPGTLPEVVDPGRADRTGTAGPKHVQRLRDEGKL